jgi:hypothetical protein
VDGNRVSANSADHAQAIVLPGRGLGEAPMILSQRLRAAATAIIT